MPFRSSHKLLTVTGLTVSAAVAVGLAGPAMAMPASGGSASGNGNHAVTTDHGRRTVATQPSWTGKARPIGTPAASAKQGLTVTLKTNQAAATKYAKSVSDPSSANYRKFLTPKQYGEKFGASDSDIAAAKKFLKSHGFTVGTVDAAKTSLSVTGSTASVRKAFGTTLRTFKRDGATVTAPTTKATIPASVSAIQGVVGLDTTPRYHTNHVSRGQLQAKATRAYAKKRGSNLAGSSAATAKGAATDSISGDGCSNYWGEFVKPYQESSAPPFKKPVPTAMCGYTPKALNKAQHVNATSTSGKGVKVGVTLWCSERSIVSDTNKWSKDMGMPKLKSGQLTTLPPKGGYNASYCDKLDGMMAYTETALDVQAVHGAAPGADIVYSAAAEPSDKALLDAFHRLIDTNKVDMISNSWGADEAEMDKATTAAYQQLFTQAAAQGMPILFASGDDGDGSMGDGSDKPVPEYPASDPWVTSVGGTTLANKKDGSIAFEEGWLTSVAQKQGDWGQFGYVYGAGGGTSDVFDQPYYQKGVVPPSLAGTSNAKRVYPDLANVADPGTGYLVGYTDPSHNFSVGNIGGTSLASPRTAGQLALAQQKAGGHRLGFLNPTIYAKGGKHLTDLKSNQMKHAYYGENDSPTYFGFEPIPLTFAMNSQSLTKETLSMAKGYDNMSGMGAVDNQANLNKLMNGK